MTQSYTKIDEVQHCLDDVGARARFLEYDDVFVVFSAYHNTLALDIAMNELVMFERIKYLLTNSVGVTGTFDVVS